MSSAPADLQREIMTTLLFDLDDTLLDNNLDDFLPAYFKALAGTFAPRLHPEKMLKELMIGSRFMLDNTRPDLTLREAFNNHFFPALGIALKEWEGEFDRFYDTAFLQLEPLTRKRPRAIALVEWAFAQGYRVVIATNPLFPAKAIHHRLRWAGLAPEKYPFALITSFETMHFTKSQPAYYAEILARLGWIDEPVVMIGDDQDFDVRSGREAGLTVFSLIEQGGIDHVRPWLESVDLASLKPDQKSTTAISAILQSTPAIFDHLLRVERSFDWTHRPAPDQWSAIEILCHLRDSNSEINTPRVDLILAQENPFIPGLNPDDWVDQRHYVDQSPAKALSEFAQSRIALINTLKSLSESQWSRKGRHAIFGPTDLRELMHFAALHDQLHVRQAQETAGRCET
jgi:FMN phosphatase YigB (HAD superfamily)